MAGSADAHTAGPGSVVPLEDGPLLLGPLFPPGGPWGSAVHRDVGPGLPSLLAPRPRGQVLGKPGQAEYHPCSVHLVASGLEMNGLVSFSIIKCLIS